MSMSFNSKYKTFNPPGGEASRKHLIKNKTISKLLNVKCLMLFIFLATNYLLLATQAYAVDLKTVFKSPFENLGDLISVLIPNVLVLAGVILLFLLIFGGFSFIINAGKGDSQGAGKGKQMVTWTIIGFILIFAAYWIIQIIEYITGIPILGELPKG